MKRKNFLILILSVCILPAFADEAIFLKQDEVVRLKVPAANPELSRIEYEDEYSYDNSDDERCEDSHSRYDSVCYRELDAAKNTKALLRVDGEIKGVVFRVRSTPSSEPELHPFLFDGSYSCSMTVGYSASHSSNFLTVCKVTLVKRGTDGAPETGGYINFEPGKLSTSI